MICQLYLTILTCLWLLWSCFPLIVSSWIKIIENCYWWRKHIACSTNFNIQQFNPFVEMTNLINNYQQTNSHPSSISVFAKLPFGISCAKKQTPTKHTHQHIYCSSFWKMYHRTSHWTFKWVAIKQQYKFLHANSCAKTIFHIIYIQSFC